MLKVGRLEGRVGESEGNGDTRVCALVLPLGAPVHRPVGEDDDAARLERARTHRLDRLVGAPEDGKQRILGLFRVVIALVVPWIARARDEVPARWYARCEGGGVHGEVCMGRCEWGV